MEQELDRILQEHQVVGRAIMEARKDPQKVGLQDLICKLLDLKAKYASLTGEDVPLPSTVKSLISGPSIHTGMIATISPPRYSLGQSCV